MARSAATAPSASAYCTFGPTWSSPSSTHTLSAYGPNIPTARRNAVDTANIAFHKTNNSTLAIGATSYLSSSSTYDSRPFKITISSPGSAYMPSNTAAVVWRGSWSDPLPAKGNKATVYLNPTWTWTTSFDVAQKKADTKTIVLHELGHAHGLAHPPSAYYCSDGGVMSPSEQSSVMNVTFTVKRSLTADDRAGLAHLY